MTTNKKTSRPEIYRVSKNRTNNGITRRRFIKMGVAGGMLLPFMSCNNYIVKPEKIKYDYQCGGLRALRELSYTLVFSPDSKFLVTGCRYHSEVRMWDLERGFLYTLYNWPSMIYWMEKHRTALAFSKDGKMLAAGNFNHSIDFWEMPEGQLMGSISAIDSINDGLMALAISPDNTQVIVGNSLFGGKGEIRIRDIATGAIITTLQMGNNGVWSMVCSPDGKYLIAGDSAGIIKIWSYPEYDLIKSFKAKESAITSIAFHPDSTTFAAGCYSNFGDDDKRIKIWDLPNGDLVHDIKGNVSNSHPLAFSPDGTLIAAGDISRIKLWDIATGELTHEFSGHAFDIRALAFSPDNNYLASGSGPHVKLWKLPDGKSNVCLFDPAIMDINDFQEVSQEIHTDNGISCNCDVVTIPSGVEIAGTINCTCDTVTLGTQCSCDSVCTAYGTYCTDTPCSCNTICTCYAI